MTLKTTDGVIDIDKSMQYLAEEDGVILSDKSVRLVKDGEYYQVWNRDELIDETDEYNRAEISYYQFLDKDNKYEN